MLRMLGVSGVASVAVARASGMRAVAQGTATPAASPPPVPGKRPDGTNLWHVIVGQMDMDKLIDVQAFLPTEITINAGDTIWFEFNTQMPGFHTVTFPSGQPAPPLFVPDMTATPAMAGGPPTLLLNPAIAWPTPGNTYDGTGLSNSGVDVFMAPGTYYQLTFTKPGTYDYLCVPHGAVMKAKVIVQEKDAALPHEQADYDQMGRDQAAAIHAAALDATAKWSKPTTTKRPDGTMLWEASAGVASDDGNGQGRVMRFLPGDMTVSVGDTVRWINRSIGEPHTVTFLSGGKPPEDIIVEPQAGGPPKIIFNSVTQLPAGGPVYTGQGYFNSGLIGQGFSNFESYELTFVAPGDYVYYCQLHGDPTSGMMAKLKVTPKM